ncbi:cell envelope integrity protein CreD [Mucilaginibacter sp. PAMB04168]|uniref:cell envelope integrity protein CreD n=1 Tax=Mucilaginibacter sp. PAMB04168 TaxID=3138567 RepID=UPI0031F687E5
MEIQKPSSPQFRDSVLLKMLVILVIAVVLLMPSSWIQGLIMERSSRQQEVINDVSDKWSGSQLIQGPVLVIPYKKQVIKRDTANKEVVKEYTETLYLMPENLFIKAKVNTETRKRGIFEVGVYKSLVSITGNFDRADLAKLQIDSSSIMYDKARLVFGISDLKGLSSNPTIKVQNQTLAVDPVLNNGDMLDNGLQAAVNLTTVTGNQIPFSFVLDLKGSEALNFLHTGKTTQVEVNGNWPSPKFDGRYLPDTNHIDQKGFNAKWRMLYYNRPFPQQWAANDGLLNSLKLNKNALFGVELHVQVDEYQKTMRTTKYAILIIVLTFVSLFLTEVIQKRKIHLFNYALIGAAMIVFYTLLLSFTEHVGYNLAYLISAVATIALIAWFTASLLANQKAASLFALILSIFYGFIFIIIQLEDLSLLVGSIALFIIVAVLMYFSRKISWD